jgi:hypothetical protein
MDQNYLEAPSSDPISTLGLDQRNLEASVHDLLISSHAKVVLGFTGDAAVAFLDVLQKASPIWVLIERHVPHTHVYHHDRANEHGKQIIFNTKDESLRLLCAKCLRKLSRRSGLLPSSLFVWDIQRIGDYPVSGGGFADIWKGPEIRSGIIFTLY